MPVTAIDVTAEGGMLKHQEGVARKGTKRVDGNARELVLAKCQRAANRSGVRSHKRTAGAVRVIAKADVQDFEGSLQIPARSQHGPSNPNFQSLAAVVLAIADGR